MLCTLATTEAEPLRSVPSPIKELPQILFKIYQSDGSKDLALKYSLFSHRRLQSLQMTDAKQGRQNIISSRGVMVWERSFRNDRPWSSSA
jgi:hypothetical protein